MGLGVAFFEIYDGNVGLANEPSPILRDGEVRVFATTTVYTIGALLRQSQRVADADNCGLRSEKLSNWELLLDFDESHSFQNPSFTRPQFASGEF